MSRSWSSAHDWKSCIPQKGIESSNLSISATVKALRLNGCKAFFPSGSWHLPFILPFTGVLPFSGEVVIVALHPRCRVLHHLFGGMGVDVEGEAGRGMTEKVLDALNVRAAGNGNCGRSVPEVMGPCVRPADAGGNLLEILVKRQDHVVPSQFIRKNQVVLVAPGRASFQPVLRLLPLFRPQIFKRNRRRLDGSGLAALGGRGKEVFTAACLLLLELLADGDPPSLEIHLFPRKAQAFPFPQSGKQAEGVSVAHGGVLYSGEE